MQMHPPQPRPRAPDIPNSKAITEDFPIDFSSPPNGGPSPEEVEAGIEGGRSRNRGGICPSGEGGDREGPQDRGVAPTETERDKSVPGSSLAVKWLGLPRFSSSRQGFSIRLGNQDPSSCTEQRSHLQKKKKIPSRMLEGHKNNTNTV